MPEAIPTPPATPTEPIAPPETPVVKTDEPLGAPGLAALQAERDARADAERRLKEFEDRDKTEAEKVADRLAAAEKRATELEAKALRTDVATAKGVPAALLSGTTQAELEASADALIAFRGETPTPSLHVPTEGSSPENKDDPNKAFAKSLFGSGA